MSGYGGWDTSGAAYGGDTTNPNEFTMQFTDPSQQQFESFSYDTSTTSQQPQPLPHSQTPSYYNPSPQPTFFVPTPLAPSGTDFDGGTGTTNFDDEPPLLEELGINPYQIIEKTRSVLNPFRHTDATILQDTDLAGPFVFCILFGFILLLSGKIHFGYIYGIGVLGCLGMYFLLNMMSMAGVSLGVTISVLGYCLLPMVGLAGLNLLLNLQDTLGLSLTIASVVWCSYSASKLFVIGLGMQKQQPLVAYPCALVYGVFALLAVF